MSKVPLSYRGEAEAELSSLAAQLTASLRRPDRKTLTLIDKALSYLHPFESPKARTANPSEQKDLVSLLNTHRQILSPYIDTAKIEQNLRRSYAAF